MLASRGQRPREFWRADMRWIVLALVAITAVFIDPRLGLSEPMNRVPSEGSPSVKPNDVVECRVGLGHASQEYMMQLCIKNPASIKTLVLEPIQKAAPDPRPAKYVIIGGLEVIRRDGSKEGYSLFLPWGHFGHGNDYFITDFSGLLGAFQMAMKWTKSELDAVTPAPRRTTASPTEK